MKGEYEGKEYVDPGKVLEVGHERGFKLTHFSPLSSEEDAPEIITRSCTNLKTATERRTYG